MNTYHNPSHPPEDSLWPEPQRGDFLPPDQPDVDRGDTVAIQFPSGLRVENATVVEVEDCLDDRWVKVQYGKTDMDVTWLRQGSVELVEKAMWAA